MLDNFSCLCYLSKFTFSKNSFRNTIRASIDLDPDKDRRYVRPNLGPNIFRDFHTFLKLGPGACVEFGGKAFGPSKLGKLDAA